jgi:hypothetical protein
LKGRPQETLGSERVDVSFGGVCKATPRHSKVDRR